MRCGRRTLSALAIKVDPSDFINALKRLLNVDLCIRLCVCVYRYVCESALKFITLDSMIHTLIHIHQKVNLPQTKNICTNRTCFFFLLTSLLLIIFALSLHCPRWSKHTSIEAMAYQPVGHEPNNQTNKYTQPLIVRIYILTINVY